MGMKVNQVMSRPVVATTPRASVRDITSQLVRAGISGMPVAEREGKVVGVITEYDIVKVILDGKQLEDVKAEDIMEKATVTVDVSADINEALKIFKEKHIIRVPVTDNGKLVGILSRTDALRGILEEPEFLIF
ncbi:MAG: CBS domain-containing protein [Symploca sp. SIO3C6]|uniref:CBS domain-containing protein n=1 Tax=Symploca sp. SIO1C4 TaxID=2607765 RepID=A0A6B3N6N0_9CYAN|nr:CBS domain-containing protein [Symploca sp. SIO3C6]NER26272.1 CBS domain-containing protein [Symploca sp. SIO1C4]